MSLKRRSLFSSSVRPLLTSISGLLLLVVRPLLPLASYLFFHSNRRLPYAAGRPSHGVFSHGQWWGQWPRGEGESPRAFTPSSPSSSPPQQQQRDEQCQERGRRRPSHARGRRRSRVRRNESEKWSGEGRVPDVPAAAQAHQCGCKSHYQSDTLQPTKSICRSLFLFLSLLTSVFPLKMS